jgi:uncharacterized membrane protein
MANFEQGDVEKNRVLGGLGYLIFFLPLITCPESRFGKFCANQGLLLWILFAAIWIVFQLLYLIFSWSLFFLGILGFLNWVCNAAVGIVSIYYAYRAVNQGSAQELPFIGNYQIIK